MTRDPQRLDVVNLGCYGKLPISREFIIADPRTVAASGFDRWVSEGGGMVKARLGATADQRISSFPRYRFYWNDGDHKLAGVISPSRDGAGRRHPFALFATLRGDASSTLSAALQVWDLQEHLAAIWDSLVAVESAAALRDAIRDTRLGPLIDGGHDQQRYQSFLADTRSHAFWQGLRDNTAPDARFNVMQALVETVEPLARSEARAFRGGLRYPLTAGAAPSSALETCFWIDLTERCLRRPLARSWFLRSPGDEGTDNDHLYLFLSAPSPNHWISLVDPQADLESISYLDRPYGSVPAATRMNPDLRALLESDATSLGDYLNWARGS